MLENRIWRYTRVFEDHNNLIKIREALDDGQSSVWFVHCDHNCDLVHQHAAYVLKARIVGIPLQEYTQREYMRRIVIFSNYTRNSLWVFLDLHWREKWACFPDMSDAEFYHLFIDQHPWTIGLCMCGQQYYGGP